jgi:peptidoglycan LD-endopeptidase LytH
VKRTIKSGFMSKPQNIHDNPQNHSPHDFLKNYNFTSVIDIPAKYYVHNFSNGPDDMPNEFKFSIGKYNELRNNMYNSTQFTLENRNIHMGIDIGAPVGEKVFCFFDGEIHSFKNNNLHGDYGPTIITKHFLGDKIIYALFGHLSTQSLQGIKVGKEIKKNEVIGFVGDKSENGGWFPHLHFQISLLEPKNCDMPGVVSENQRAMALQNYPDPRWILGSLY